MPIKNKDLIELYINNFATRSFRNTADLDYIAARMCYRAALYSQFLWSALQAFEKYYKAILLYNRIVAKDIKHDLAIAQKYAKKLCFVIELSASSIKLLEHLNSYGQYRYLEVSYFVKGSVFAELDKAVWELRRYCRVLDIPFQFQVKNLFQCLP
ncbi:HEPN domain-containing protein [Nitrosomonas sp. Nm166]|uniref:HEPN domain-containing protein n=1 Tax=Nitrosomonas sp. Nm166 TaxID=1881054 RepID=UPI0015A71E47|nr:HEPN domain-containing protein [Nitrosomonas sp. Nm166]